LIGSRLKIMDLKLVIDANESPDHDQLPPRPEDRLNVSGMILLSNTSNDQQALIVRASYLH
jgi:hypothetical protein